MFVIRRRRTLIKLLSFVTAAFVVAGGLAGYGIWLAYSYRMSIEYSYQRALSELTVHVNSIDLELQKAVYAGTPTQMVGLSSQIWRDSTAAKSNLEQLPLNDAHLDNTYKFISQVGDFANSMSKNVAFNQKITDSDRTKMVSLSSYAKKLTQQLGNMTDSLRQGRLTIFTAKKAASKASDNNAGRAPAIDTGFQDIENGFNSMPTLIYDGPFSDNVAKKAAALTKGKSKISRKEAAIKAAGFLSTGTQNVKSLSDTAGNLPVYNFTSGSANISVSINGGYVVRMADSSRPSQAKMTAAQALVKARAYLDRFGIGSMKESYYQTNNNVCVINYAYMQGDVICYPDLIKVGISLDSGKLVSFDATGYIMNHTKRNLTSPKISAAQAQKLLSPYLKVQKVSLAVIPMEDTSEAFCYEFKCKGRDGQTVLDYFDANTGREDQLLILLTTPGGTLAI